MNKNNQHSRINLNNSLMKTLRAVNSLSGKSAEDTDLKNHRKTLERAGRLASPKGSVSIRRFKVGNIPCEMIKPDFAHNPQYAILYAHGGGYISGGLFFARILAAKMAIATGFTTYSFEYRLAPENPYPAALDDGIAVWEYLTKSRYTPDHIILAGDSAGGNMILRITQELLESVKPVPRCLLMFSPWTDMTGASGSYEEMKNLDPVLTKKYIVDAANAYISGAGDPSDPRFSPLYGELAGLPPVFIMAGRNEILLDDSIRLRDGILQAGGSAELDIEEDGWHVYQQMPVPMAKRAMKRLSDYICSEIYGAKPQNRPNQSNYNSFETKQDQ